MLLKERDSVILNNRLQIKGDGGRGVGHFHNAWSDKFVPVVLLKSNKLQSKPEYEILLCFMLNYIVTVF